MEVLNEGCSLGLLVPAATVSCSFFWLVACQQQFFCLESDSSLFCTLFHLLSAHGFCCGVGIDIRNGKSAALLGLLFLFASHSPNCFCFVVTFYLYLVSLSITCRNWNIRNRNCKSALLGLFSFFLQVALLIVFRFCILSSSCFLVTPFILRCCSEIEMQQSNRI